MGKPGSSKSTPTPDPDSHTPIQLPSDEILSKEHVKNEDGAQETLRVVRALIKRIDRMVKQNGGGCYTDEMYRMAEEAIPKEERRLHQAYGEEMERKACELFQQKLLQAEAQRQGERGHGNGNGNDAGQEAEPVAGLVAEDMGMV
ncbi:hypothetical protein AAFF_G00248150 [Aldrovandia affinis]|uniref:Uncharacterized protein n=1 Tax=Aldrovandia affinis TaxID=143900 RepID=A0AAD7RDK4_9TELE|nr:hypothetical protein AAFF_G00248150 [Aldrovandia affinis]